MAWLVTDLPQPDSPTMPSVLPRSSVKLTPSTDLTSPSSVGKWTRRSRTSRKAVGAPLRPSPACLSIITVTTTPAVWRRCR